ncbi:MAG: carbohydrate kinase family protein [Salibacteraceae bacterium]
MQHNKVAVLGPIPRDTIISHRGETIEKYGCVTHTAIALANLMNGKGEIVPVTHIRKSDTEPILEIFKAYPNINTEHISNEFDSGDVIQLRFVDQNNRLEKQTSAMSPILPNDVKAVLDADVFVCVPVTDYEVPLETIKFIKEYSKATVVFDAHGPTNGLSHQGDRFMKLWVTRDQWLPYLDVLKMNLEEAGCSWFKKEYQMEELNGERRIERHEIPDFARHCLHHGLRCLCVTLDEKGVLVYTVENGQLREDWIKSIPVNTVVDTTGCGDSFAGGLAYGLLANHFDYIGAAKYANAMGAQRTQGKTFEVFKPIAETQAMIDEFYAEKAAIETQFYALRG